MSQTPEEEKKNWANSVLPQAPHSVKADPAALCYTLIAEPKFGKTSWGCAIPDSLLLAFEKGHAFVSAHKIEIDAWDYNVPESRKQQPWEEEGTHLVHMTLLQAVEAVIASDRFATVVVDTADMAAKMCTDFHIKKNGLTHPNDWEFGKGHEVCLNAPFRQAFGKILKSGRGVVFITHSSTTDARFAGQTKSKKECTLPSGVSKFLIPQSDVILHGRFGPVDPTTKRRTRIWQTEGTDEVLAGARGVGQQFNLPPKFIINQAEPWAQWIEFFEDMEAANRATAEYQALKGNKAMVAAETPAGEATENAVPDPVKKISKPKAK